MTEQVHLQSLKQICGYQGLGVVSGDWLLMNMGFGVSGGWNVLKLGCGDTAQLCDFTKTSDLHTSNWSTVRYVNPIPIKLLKENIQHGARMGRGGLRGCRMDGRLEATRGPRRHSALWWGDPGSRCRTLNRDVALALKAQCWESCSGKKDWSRNTDGEAWRRSESKRRSKPSEAQMMPQGARRCGPGGKWTTWTHLGGRTEWRCERKGHTALRTTGICVALA